MTGLVVALVASVLVGAPVEAQEQGAVVPFGCSFEVGVDGIDVRWTETDDADRYVVERRVNGGNWFWAGAEDAPATVLDPMGALPAAGADADIEFRMDTVTGGARAGSPVTCVELEPGVAECTFAVLADGVDVRWTDTAGVSRYIVERQVNGGDWYWTAAQDAPATALDELDGFPGAGPDADMAFRVDTRIGPNRTNNPTDCTEIEPAGREAPFGFFATSDGVSEVEISWIDPFDDDLDRVDVVLDGSVAETVTAGVERFTRVNPTGGEYRLVAHYTDGFAISSEPANVTLGAPGTCRVTRLAGTSTAALWTGAPDGWLWLSEPTGTGYEPLSWMTVRDGTALVVDTTRDWADVTPDYRVSALDHATDTWATGTCSVAELDEPTRSDLAAAGLPVLADGRPGSDTPSGDVQLVALPGHSVPSTDPTTAPDLCSVGGRLKVDLPAARHSVYAKITIPAGAWLSFDYIDHRDTLETWRGEYWATALRLHVRNDDGTLGLKGFTSSGTNGVFLDRTGDVYEDDDTYFGTNYTTERDFILELETFGDYRIGTADGAHTRAEDFKLRHPDGTVTDLCGVEEINDCKAEGGNVLVDTPIDYQGQTLQTGCYNQDGGCHTDIGPVIDVIAEWACENDALLDAALLAGLVVVIVAGLLVIGAPAIVAVGAGIGAASSLWACDKSGNGTFRPAGSIGDVHLGCAAFQTALGGIGGGVHAYAAKALAAGGASFLPAVAVSCGIGGAEGAAAVAGTAYLLPDQDTELTPTVVGAALGCATAGIIGGTQAHKVRVRNASQADDDVVRGISRCFRSFSADTEVLMADGTTLPISQIQIGDWVHAEDPETGERGPREVTELWVHQDTLVDILIGGDRLTTTEDHPFWNATEEQWQQADALDPGDSVLTAEGQLLEVGGIDWASAHTGTAYNLSINDIHTYYVGVADESVLVHNVGCDEAAIEIKAEWGGDIKKFKPPQSFPVLGEYKLAIDAGVHERWYHHTVVVKDGLVRDQFTPNAGVPIEEWKNHWLYADDIDFGF